MNAPALPSGLPSGLPSALPSARRGPDAAQDAGKPAPCPMHVGVIDIGKTNVKLAVIERTQMTQIACVTRPNTVLPGPPWPHFDVAGHWKFILDSLAALHRAHRIDAITVTTHGACGALLDKNGNLAAPVLDYEHDGPDQTADAYNAIRPAFSRTGSPRLARGLNLGAQLYWMMANDPDLAARTACLLPWPQYWAFRLTGIRASDPTSLGCHSDLWLPKAGHLSSIVPKLALDGKIAPLRACADRLGPVHGDIARKTGLAPDTPVYCGIHDSSATLLPHLLIRDAPFSVVSTGTWVVVMAVGAKPVTLDPARDIALGTNALGEPVPTAKFMGGRELDTIMDGQIPPMDDADLASVLGRKIMLLPAINRESGPFQNRTASWPQGEPPHGSGTRMVAASFYLAMMTATCLELIGHDGPVIVEGPFAANAQWRQMLSAATGCPVVAAAGMMGTSQGAALLADLSLPLRLPENITITGQADAGLRAWAQEWRRKVAAPATHGL